MGTDAREQKIDIKSQLLQESSNFSYIQAIRLLDLFSRSGESHATTKIRTRPRLSLDFPSSDIVKIEELDDTTKITVTFMGLYGESSPLPTFYTEILLEEEREDKSVVRDFIDIFNGPIYEAYFKVWLKNQLGVRLNEYNDSKIVKLLHTFSGISNPSLREKYKDKYALLKYAGLNMQFPRSAEALRTLISDIVGNEAVEIIQCVEQMAAIPIQQQCKLGQCNTSLDDNLHLGNSIKDRMGKFRIIINDLDMEGFNALLPKREKFIEMVEAIKFYVGEGLDWDCKLVLRDDVCADVVLGAESELSLGLNTWLGKDQNKRVLFLSKNHNKRNREW